MAKRLFFGPDGSLQSRASQEAKPYWVRGHEQPFTDFDGFAALLNQAVQTDAAVIHGEIIPGTDTRRMRRLLLSDGDTPPTIRDRLCPYIILDVDHLPLPDNMSVQADPDVIVSFVRDSLPSELRDVSFWFHHSHSAGTSPFAKMHLAFLLAAPMACRDLDRWVRYINEREGIALFDPAPYSPNDFIFVGNPVRDPGVKDPVPRGKRTGIVRGTIDEAVISLPDNWKPPHQRRSLEQGPDIRATTGVGVPGVAAALKRLGPECHSALLDAVKAAFRGRELLVDDDSLAVRFERAIEKADWSASSHTDDYFSKEINNLPRLINWYRGAVASAVDRTPYGMPEPHYPTPAMATVALGKALDGFFTQAAKWQTKQADVAADEDTPDADDDEDDSKDAKKNDKGDAAPLMAVKATTGSGKTRGVVSRLLDTAFQSVLYFAPTHNVLAEIAEALEQENAKRGQAGGRRWEILHIYGRGHRDTVTGAYTMCQRGDVAERVQAEGGIVARILCGTDDHPKCPYHAGCPFIAQSRRLREAEVNLSVQTVTLMATHTLPTRRPGGVRSPDLVIIDEAFWSPLLATRYAAPHPHLKLDTMRGIRWVALADEKDADGNVVKQVEDKTKSAELNRLWQGLVAMLDAASAGCDDHGFISRSAITMDGADLERLRRGLGKCRRNVDLALVGAIGDAAILKALAGISEINERVVIYRGLIDLLAMEREKTTAQFAATVSLRDGQVLYRRAREPRALGGSKGRRATPTLFLDADLDPEVVRQWWPGLREEDVVDVTCGWSPHVKVVHVKGQTFSKSWALGSETGDAAEQRRVAKHQADLDAFVRHVMELNGATPEETMLVSYKDLIEALGKGFPDGLYAVPSDPAAPCSVGWFNALAGIDRWKNVRVGIVVGRPQATPEAYSDMARAIWGQEDRDWLEVPPDSAGRARPPRQRFRLRTKKGVVPATVWATELPDDRSSRMFRLVTWGQPMQADGRIRPVHRTEESPCVLYILGEVPRGVAADAVMLWEDAVPDRFDRVVARAAREGCVVPTSAGALAVFAPDIWTDAKAVERDCRLQADDAEVLVPVLDWIGQAVRKAEQLALPSSLNKHPLHAIYTSYSTEGGLSIGPAATPAEELPSADTGTVRRVKQRGSATPWVQTPTKAITTLSEALVNTFGPAIANANLGHGEPITISDLINRERGAVEAKAKSLYETLNAALKAGEITQAQREILLFQEIGTIMAITYADTPLFEYGEEPTEDAQEAGIP